MTSIVPKDLGEDELVHVIGTFGLSLVFFSFFYSGKTHHLLPRHILAGLQVCQPHLTGF